MAHSIVILGIESSCDETGAAVLCDGKIYANETADQKMHEKYGGVVPELASRAHQQNIVPVVQQVLKDADISLAEITAIAYTNGPGLIGALLVGSSFAKGMALVLNVPLIGVNHLHAHVLAHFTISERNNQQSTINYLPITPRRPEESRTDYRNPPPFPFLCLTVSGGHTQLVLVRDHLAMEIIGETLDDAAGEAFDKAARLLNLSYPGGPMVDKFAQIGNPDLFRFPYPDIPGLDFSFSGLKTSFLYFLRKQVTKNQYFIEENLSDLCASIQKTIIDILLDKLVKASLTTKVTHIAIAGGVASNSALRKALKEKEIECGWKTYIPKLEYCTDNAAMIATAGYYMYINKIFSTQHAVPSARLDF